MDLGRSLRYLLAHALHNVETFRYLNAMLISAAVMAGLAAYQPLWRLAIPMQTKYAKLVRQLGDRPSGGKGVLAPIPIEVSKLDFPKR